MLSMLGKNFSKQNFKAFLLIFPRKKALTYHADCLLRRHFLGKRKKISIMISKLEKFQQTIFWNIFSYFSQKIKALIFHTD